MATLSTLISRLRSAIGETGTDSGSWSDAELTDYLNRAQRMVVDDIHTSKVPWASTRPHSVPISGNRFYVMPADFLDIQHVSHRISQQDTQPMDEADVLSLYDYHDYTADRYRNWELPNTIDAPYIAEGVATGGSSVSLVDSTPLVDFSDVKIGDLVFNLSDDNAYAEVTAVNTEAGTF